MYFTTENLARKSLCICKLETRGKNVKNKLVQSSKMTLTSTSITSYEFCIVLQAITFATFLTFKWILFKVMDDEQLTKYFVLSILFHLNNTLKKTHTYDICSML